MRVLVCGGRNYRDQKAVDFVLDLFDATVGKIHLLIEGGATGADRSARWWASARGVHVATVNALWEKRGPIAGKMRNGVMLELQPEAVIAFPGNNGTRDMIQQAAKAGVPVYGVFDEPATGLVVRLMRVGADWSGHELEDRVDG